MSSGPYGSVAEIARAYSWSSRTVRRLVQRGAFEASRAGDRGHLRIRFGDVEEFLARHRAVIHDSDEEFIEGRLRRERG